MHRSQSPVCPIRFSFVTIICIGDSQQPFSSYCHHQVARNNAKSQLEDADWKKVQLETERLQLHEEMEVVKATVEDLKLTCQRHLEDKRELKASLSEAQKKLQEASEKLQEKDRCISEGKAQQNKKVCTTLLPQ